jgi:putative membrane protein
VVGHPFIGHRREASAPTGRQNARTVLMRFARRLLYMWIFNVIALFACEKLIDGIEFSGNFGTLVLAGLVFAFVNLLLKPVTKLLALPLIIVTLGIALFFINILMLYITSWIVSGFDITHFGAAIWATIVIWGVNWILQIVFDVDDRTKGR